MNEDPNLNSNNTSMQKPSTALAHQNIDPKLTNIQVTTADGVNATFAGDASQSGEISKSIDISKEV